VFQHFTTQDGLAHNQVFSIQPDRQERLWFSTLKGVCWYDGADFHYLEGDGIATNGQIKGTKGAAALLGVPPSTLYHKMRKLGIKT